VATWPVQINREVLPNFFYFFNGIKINRPGSWSEDYFCPLTHGVQQVGSDCDGGVQVNPP
jgi:hypothetical protein